MHEDRDSRKAERLRQQRDAQLRPTGSAPDGSDAPPPPDVEVAALRYDSANDHAPKLVARGKGHTAQRILELAEAHDLPVTKDPTLVAILGALDVGADIPPDLYGVIAEVLAWAYHTDKLAADRRRRAA